eukprot:gb/GECG01014831.1/.p1 GENE.gb/GECG01014831.1/~~gb/GECG01014831.1/.p1  ORF type:complete len:178 (+),score=31.49 gb/GECG01014831.1/:1-534(+)
MKHSGEKSKRSLGRVRFKRKEQEEPHQAVQRLDGMLQSHPGDVAKLSESTANCVNKWVGEITEKERKVKEYKSKAEDLVQTSSSLNELKSRVGTIRRYANQIDEYGQPVDVDSQLILDTLLEGDGGKRLSRKSNTDSSPEVSASDEPYGSVYSLYGEMGTKKRRLTSLRPVASNKQE